MNRLNFSVHRIGMVLCGALMAGLSGCTTYVQPPPAPEVYTPPPPIYAPPPPIEPAPPAVDVTFTIRTESDFYDPLTPYGRWVMIGGYGRCWVPDRPAPDWRPYCNGHWQRTDAGWYWVSDEPWGWATYHYGRWDFDPQFGWFWVPQTQWAPAWVSFHEGGGYVGWAPLPPSARVRSGGYVDVNVGRVAPRGFVFVEEKRFLEPVRPTTVVVNNTTIINKTVNVTKIKVVNNTVINEGPNTTVIEKAHGKKIETVPAREIRRKLEAPVVAKQPRKPPVAENKPEPPTRVVPPPSEPREPREPKPVQPREPRPNERPVATETVAPAKPLPPGQARQPVEPREPRPNERPAVTTGTAAPARPVPPGQAKQVERPRSEPAGSTPVPAPTEAKSQGKPSVNRAPGREVQREENQGRANPVIRPGEQPVRGHGAERQVKGAKETGKGKGAEKGKKKNQEPESPPEKPVSPP